MFYQNKKREQAEKSSKKKADFGKDLNLEKYNLNPTSHAPIEEKDLALLPEQEQNDFLMAGIDLTGKNRGGTFLMKDSSTIHCSVKEEGIEVLNIKDALKNKDWIDKYYWKLVDVETDKYTSTAATDLHDGYVIRALPGKKSILPIQACLYMKENDVQQNVHNIIIAEEDSELHIISGCSSDHSLKRGLHVGISEFFVKKNAKLSFTMIHNWNEGVSVRPRSATKVEEGGLFISNYICMKPVNSLQMYPTCFLEGINSIARFYSILVGAPNGNIDAGSRVYLNHPKSKAEIISRAITNGGEIMARGHLIGKAKDIKAHLECRGLILNGGAMLAVPQLDGFVDGVEMSHEAAVGKIAQDEINYLMARGLNEEEATATIVRGFLSINIPGLPDELQKEIDKAINITDSNSI